MSGDTTRPLNRRTIVLKVQARRIQLVVVALAIVAASAVMAVPEVRGQLTAAPQWAPPAVSASPSPSPSPSPIVSPHLTLRAQAVQIAVKGFLAWALLDRRTGLLNGSKTAAVSSTESMIKVWIVADFLRRRAVAGRKPSATQLSQARAAIIHSDDNAAEVLYRDGGTNAVIRRLISRCGLQDTFIGDSGWWSRTQISARDAVRMGECIASGRAAGPKWTEWVLDQMRRVEGTTDQNNAALTRGGGRWGIIDGLPESVVSEGVSIKNGWTQIGKDPVREGPARDNTWHVNCLAVHADWVLAVLLRYPATYPLDYGAKVCANVTRQLVTTEWRPRGDPERAGSG